MEKIKERYFYYKRNLYNYCLDNNIFSDIPESTFKDWLSKNKENLNEYFKNNNRNIPEIRFETSKGQQAQLDWKESIKFVLVTGEVIEINVLSSSTIIFKI